MSETKRVQFRVSGEYVEVLDDLKERLNASSRSETIKTAISLLRWALDHLEEGNRVVAIEDGKKVEIHIPGFEFVKQAEVKSKQKVKSS